MKSTGIVIRITEQSQTAAKNKRRRKFNMNVAPIITEA